MITLIAWVIIITLFVLGMIGAVYPVLPGTLAVYAAFFVYGSFISFKPFGVWFWTIETIITAAIFAADYAVSALGIRKFGGSRASVIGSTIGIIIGPFVIPAFGLILGPFIGAVVGELIHGSGIKPAVKVGVVSLVGLFSSMVMKILLQLVMIIIFVIWLL